METTAAGQDDAFLAQVRLREAYEFVGHVEAIHTAPPRHEKDGSPLAHDVAVNGEGSVLRCESCVSQETEPLVEDFGRITRDICEKLTERSLPDDDWTRMKLPTSLGG